MNLKLLWKSVNIQRVGEQCQFQRISAFRYTPILFATLTKISKHSSLTEYDTDRRYFLGWRKHLWFHAKWVMFGASKKRVIQWLSIEIIDATFFSILFLFLSHTKKNAWDVLVKKKISDVWCKCANKHDKFPVWNFALTAINGRKTIIIITKYFFAKTLYLAYISKSCH